MQKEKRKGVPTLFLAFILFTIGSVGWITVGDKKQEPTYKVSLTLSGWQNMVDCLKKSTAESVRTNALIDEIGKQIDPILQAEQKIQDSLNKIKKPNKN